MKILLFGKNGQVGWELNRSLLPIAEVVAFGREEADFSKPENIRSIIQKNSPDVIVNAAAYTAVDKAEEDEKLAETINAEVPGIIAEEALKINALLVHYSTDYIFDGKKSSPYIETDTPNPVNAYGRTKLHGELNIQSSGCDYLILRTSWVYASRGENFLKTIVRLAREKEELDIISDQFGTPTWARYIADATAFLIQKKLARNVPGGSRINNIFHLSSKGECSWYQFADLIVSELKRVDRNLNTVINSITSEQYPTKAKRPENAVLCTDKVEHEMFLHNPGWDKSVKLCLNEI